MLFKSLLEQPLLGNASLTPPQLVKILQDVSWDAYENWFPQMDFLRCWWGFVGESGGPDKEGICDN